MKTLLIVAALNLQLVYDDASVCRQAQTELKNNNIESICIPKGETVKQSDMFAQFMAMVTELQQQQQEGTIDVK